MTPSCSNAPRREVEAKTRAILMGGEVDINSLVDNDDEDLISGIEEDELDFREADDLLAEEEGKLVAA